MTRQRLRPAYTDDQLAGIYATPHDSSRWRDHKVRVGVTVELGRGLLHEDHGVQTVADLSCGDGTIARSLGAPTVILGDYAPRYEHTGPLEHTLDAIQPVDLYVCSETLEHLDDPDLVLKLLRQKTRYLLLSTPLDAWDEQNPEHYWAWSREDVEEMLRAAGFTTMKPFVRLDLRESWSPYCFGVWVAS